MNAPEWTILLPFLLFAAWRWRGRLGSPLRIACLALLVLVLAEPRWPRGGGLDVWVLFDRSASARDLLEPKRAEIESLLARGRHGGDRLFLVDYAEQAAQRSPGSAPSGPGAETRTASAALYALSHRERERAARLLVVTDGYATEPLTGLAERLAAEGVALDYRLLTPAAATDYQAEAVFTPARVQASEPFVIEVRVTGTPDADVPLTIRRDRSEIGQAVARVRAGAATLRFTDRVRAPGAFRYSVELRAPGDAVHGNDRAATWVEVAGGPRALVVTQHVDSPLAAALRTQAFEVEQTEPGNVTVGGFAGTRLVVLDDVSADRLPRETIAALNAYVRIQGGGVLMTGGPSSFGSGGWFASPIDPLLPVSMELRREHRRLAVSMAIVMDRSGSMSAPVAPGVTKMDMANAGAARSIELLGELDAVAVIAVDSEAHRIVPLSTLGSERARVVDIVKRVHSEGGGIFIYRGLFAGWEELRLAPHKQRHILLFADAADSEEPDRYKELLGIVRGGGGTVSVIAMGTPQDQDAALLMDIAGRGGGRIFFGSDPASLPELFAQDTVAVARSAYIDEPTGARFTAGWLELAARPPTGLDAVDGYNLCYLREGATAAALTADKEPQPLVAAWQRGTGRVAAVTFPLSGPGATRTRAWPGYGDLVQTLGRWLAGAEAPPGMATRTRLDGNCLRIELLHDAGWQERLARTPPRALIVEGVSGEPRPVPWTRLAPGHLVATVALEPDRLYRGAVEAGGAVLPFGPVETPPGAEWRRDRARVRELRAVSTTSGGEERADLGAIWQATRPASRDLRTPLLVVVLVLFLVEALRARLDLELADVPWLRRRGRAAPVPAPADAAPAVSRPAFDEPLKEPPAAGETPPDDAPPAEDPGTRTRERLRRARKRGR